VFSFICFVCLPVCFSVCILLVLAVDSPFVAADYGRESVMMAQHFAHVRGDANHWICVKSVNNMRSERLWRDVNFRAGTYDTWALLFRDMETDANIRLNPDDPIDLFSLHYVFAPRIQAGMDRFCEMWNNHKMRALKYRSPWQWLSGSMGVHNIASDAGDFAAWPSGDALVSPFERLPYEWAVERDAYFQNHLRALARGDSTLEFVFCRLNFQKYLELYQLALP